VDFWDFKKARGLLDLRLMVLLLLVRVGMVELSLMVMKLFLRVLDMIAVLVLKWI
jgi:hypothetical protein